MIVDQWFDARSLLTSLTSVSRAFRRTPGSLVAIGSLGIAVGAVGAVLSNIDWLLYRQPGGVVAPAEVVGVQKVTVDRGSPGAGPTDFSYPQFMELERVQNSFTHVAAYGKLSGVLAVGDHAEQGVIEFVSAKYFELLGVPPEIGRLINEDDYFDEATPVAVLSFPLWRSWFGGSSTVIDSTIRLNGVEVRVVGVLPPEFEGYHLDWNGPSSVWVPASAAEALGEGGMLRYDGPFFPVLGRLAPGVDPGQALDRSKSWMEAISSVGSDQISGLVLQPSWSVRIGQRAEAQWFLGTLLAVCLMLLGAACLNVVNFVIGYSHTRRADMGLRLALGASPQQLRRLLVVEAGCFASAVSLVAVVTGAWGSTSLAKLPSAYLGIPTPITRLQSSSSLTPKLLVGIGLTTVILAGLLHLLPRLAIHKHPKVQMRQENNGWSWTNPRMTPRQFVVILQVCVAVGLAVPAGLYVRSFLDLAQLDSEFVDPSSVLLVRVSPVGVTPEDGDAFYDRLGSRLTLHEAVLSHSIGWNPPFRQGWTEIGVPGDPEVTVTTGSTTAGSSFFETVGIAMLAGREFVDQEEQAVAVVNSVLAERLWPGEPGVGQTVLYRGEPYSVVGITARQKCRSLAADGEPCFWRPFPAGSSGGYLRIRTAIQPGDFLPLLTQIASEINPNVAIYDGQSLDEYLKGLNAESRLTAISAGALALAAIVLLTAGLSWLLLSMVHASRKELAILVSVGASATSIAKLMAGRTLLLVGTGTGLGLLVAHLAAIRIAPQLHRTTAYEPTVYLVPILVVCLVSIASIASAVWAVGQLSTMELLKGR